MGRILAVDDEPDMLSLIKMIIEGYSDHPIGHGWLKPDFQFRGDEADRIDYDLRTCSFLRRDSDGRYYFSHRSFLEYFSALHLLDSVESKDCPLLVRGLASYWTTISWEWPSDEIRQFLLSLLHGDPKSQSRILKLTHAS